MKTSEMDLIKKCLFKHNVLPILDGQFAVQNGIVISSDLQTTISLDIAMKIEDGIYNRLFLKTNAELDRYPIMPEIINPIKIKGNVDFLEQLKRIYRFAGKDELRQAMLGVFLDFENHTIVATNANVMQTEKLELSETKTSGCIVPPFDISLLEQILKHFNTRSFDIEIGENAKGAKMIAFLSEKFNFSIHLIDAVFPSYKSVIPTKIEKGKSFQFSNKTIKQMQMDRREVQLLRGHNDIFWHPIMLFDNHAKFVDIDFGVEFTYPVTIKNRDSEFIPDPQNCNLLTPCKVDIAEAEGSIISVDLQYLEKFFGNEVWHIIDKTHVVVSEHNIQKRPKQLFTI